MPSSKFEDRPIFQKGFDKKKTVLRETLIQNHFKKHKPHATRGSQASQCSEFSQKHQWRPTGQAETSFINAASQFKLVKQNNLIH